MRVILPLLFGLLFLLQPAPVRAQGVGAAGTIGLADTASPHRIGIAGGFDLLFHHADFQTLPGVSSCCSNYGSGSGTGFAIAIIYEYALSDRWAIGGRLAYERAGATFNDRERTTLIVGGHATDGWFNYDLDAHYQLLMVQPTVSYRFAHDILGRLSLYGHLGFGLGVNVGSGYMESERISAPDGIGTYTGTGDAVRNQSAGGIPQAAAVAADLRPGLGIEAQLNAARTITLGPEIWYSIGLSHVVHALAWRADALRLGLSLRYRLM
ncbi:MAG: outer membrane beta-barrel protein [Bacteroidetes bacterium]|nr:outer membrane beta-barrel protein [Bacteroidota bacterium]